MPRPLRVFLCHASQDKPAVWRLHRYLTQHGVKPWLDQEDLLPGEDWEVEIPNAIYSSDVILVCLSKNSVNKEGMVQKEISFALDKALEKPGKIFIIPVKLEECDVPNRLSRYQWVDYFRPDGRKRLLMSLNKRVTELGGEASPVIMEDSRQRTPRPQSPKPEMKPEEQTALIPQKEEIKEKPKFPIGGLSAALSSEALSKDSREPQTASAAYREVPEGRAPNDVKQKLPKKPVTKFLDPSSLSPKEIISPLGEVVPSIVDRVATSYAKSSPTYAIVGGIIFVGLLIVLFGRNYILNNLPATQTPAVTPSVTARPPTSTATSVPPTATFTSVPPTPTLGIGSTMISEKDDMVLVYVPEGEFIMGSVSYPDAQPVHRVFLDGYWIDQTEVTNAMYARCVDAGQCNLGFENDSDSTNYPVTSVSWYDANDYCKYVGRRLPTEAQWEKAARGENGYTYPWGNKDPQGYLLNHYGKDGIYTDVGSYPAGASVYGALDMAGSVSEWVSSLYAPYPYDATDGREDLSSFEDRVMRGSSTMSNNRDIPSALRGGEGGDPTLSAFILGFRCSLSP
ncbi:MAG: SUMF1/EgtB/PvdO family nonheme iron enzyme [Chloroflexi bacterium]|nr:SUMF1/EgtB/PvdO family nonheme iron enzyme [Chloroflexota bacterium]